VSPSDKKQESGGRLYSLDVIYLIGSIEEEERYGKVGIGIVMSDFLPLVVVVVVGVTVESGNERLEKATLYKRPLYHRIVDRYRVPYVVVVVDFFFSTNYRQVYF